MLQTLTELGTTGTLSAGFALGGLLGTLLTAWAMRRQGKPAEEEMAKMRSKLRSTQVKLDQARKNCEALEVEVTEWRRRNSARQAARAAGNSRYVSSTPAPEPEAWVIGALLEGDKLSRDGKSSGFADTQILPAH